jgi:hypothetical protein
MRLKKSSERDDVLDFLAHYIATAKLTVDGEDE